MTANNPSLDWVPELLGFVRRSALVVTVCAGIGIAAGVVYQFKATPHFTAGSVVMIDVEAGAPFRQQTGTVDSQFANALVESQVEVLQSQGLARKVVQNLHLADDRAFLRNGDTLLNAILGTLLQPFATPVSDTAESRETAAADLLTRMIRVRRIGISFILELSVTARDAAMSARLANALVDSFAEAGLEAKGVNTRRASQWLQGRIAELQGQAFAADRDAQAFKAQAGIVDTDKGLMNERHLGELNSQLVLARARVADTRAKLDRIREVMKTGATGDVSDALQNTVITHLREQYVDAARQAAEWEARVGPNHTTVLQARAKLRDIQSQIQLELKRIADGTESDWRVAVSNQRDIEAQLGGLVTDADRTNVDLVRLRELQSNATTYKALYADFLQRYTQAVQDQSFPVSDVRIVSRASEPLRKSWPKALIVLAGGAAAGLALGFTICLLREATDRGLRQASQVRQALGLACLGVLPAFRARKKVRRELPLVVSGGMRRLSNIPPMLRQVSLSPLSAYAEAIRGLRVRVLREKEGREKEGRRDVGVLGFVSAVPGEGKSTTSANFAFLLAEAGVSTLLIDADVRKRPLSRMLVPGCRAGLIELVAGTATLEEAIWRDPTTGLNFLPASAEQVREHALQPLNALHSNVTPAFLASLRKQFDMVIIDLPAILPVADAAAAVRFVDGVIMVVEWGSTPIDTVLESLESAGIDSRRMLGVVLNKASPGSLRAYPMIRTYGHGDRRATRVEAA